MSSEAVERSSIDRVKQWLLDYEPQMRDDKPDLDDLELDFDLIENRVIDSMGFMDFLFFLEDLAGRELVAEAQSPDNFRTLRAIRDRVLREKA